MEQQLAEYRARKAKELRDTGGFLNALKRQNKTSECITDKNEPKFEGSTQVLGYKTDKTGDRQLGIIGKLLHRYDISLTKLFFLKLVLWLILFGLFIEIEFGSVYFIASFFYLIYATLSTDRRDPEKLSAYSVFNPNFETLDGQFTAEQFERELRYGPGSVGSGN